MVPKCIGVAIAACCFALPALADGRDQARVEGPAPLMPVECHLGHAADEACYVRREATQIIRRPAVTRVVTQLPTTTHRVVQSSAATTQGFDFSGLNGGVGAGVSGGFVGGGNVIVIREEGQRFSGVRSSAVGRAVLSGRLGGSGY